MDKKSWFRSRKWGVFFHYLSFLQNNPETVNSNGRQTSWDECVNDLDVDMIAEQLHEVNAGYLVFTVTQGSRFVIAPNETYDRLTGFEPGYACSRRDLIRDLIDALAKYDIPLFLYFTADGPCRDADERVGKAMDTPDLHEGSITPEFVERWTAVLREYSLRYSFFTQLDSAGLVRRRQIFIDQIHCFVPLYFVFSCMKGFGVKTEIQS